jgi:hypothetical protein
MFPQWVKKSGLAFFICWVIVQLSIESNILPLSTPAGSLLKTGAFWFVLLWIPAAIIGTIVHIIQRLIGVQDQDTVDAKRDAILGLYRANEISAPKAIYELVELGYSHQEATALTGASVGTSDRREPTFTIRH